MSRSIDISARLRPGVTTWPTSVGFAVHPTRAIERGDEVNESRLDMDVHVGTHIEGPLHFIDGGAPVESIPLETLIGPAHVELVADADDVGPDELSGVPEGVERLLIRTRNSDEWHGDEPFRTDYVALTQEGARRVVERGIRLVGIDYVSIQRFDDDPETHRILLRGGVTILEGLHLADVAPGTYRLVCLPLRLEGTEASPARAILEPMS